MSPAPSDGFTHCTGRPVARSVAEAGARQRVLLTGTLASVAVRHHRALAEPVHHAGPRSFLEAELDDTTGTIVLRWLGRDAIGGIAVGASLAVEGTVLTEHGRHVVLNPIYSLLE